MTLPDASLEETLERLSNEVAGTFSIAFFELDTIRNTAGDFGTDIGRLLDVSVPEDQPTEAEGAFDAFLQNAASAAAAAEDAAASLTDRAFQGALVRVSGSLLEMKKHTVSLTTISSLTKVSQAEAPELWHRLTAFTDALDDRCRRLKAATARSTELVVETQRQSGLARDRLTGIGLEFRALSDGAVGEAERLDALSGAHHAYMSELRDDATRLDAEVRSAVAGLIGCLQFPDSFRQRSEHVRAAIAAMEGESEADRAALSKVATAQLDAMARALTEVATTASRAMSSLRHTLKRSPIIQSRSDASNPSDAWMTATARANDSMLVSLDRARGQFGAALKLINGLTTQIDATQGHLEAAVGLIRDLETSVHNASLVAHRSGSQNSPIRFLARSVKDVVDRTSVLIGQVSEALAHIRGTSQALAASSLERDLETLLALQEAAATEAAMQAQGVKLVREMRHNLLEHADRIGSAATAGGNACDDAVDRGRDVAELGRQIGEDAPPTDTAGSDLSWLYASYTMEEERLVHREVLGLPAPEAVAEDADADLDDFML